MRQKPVWAQTLSWWESHLHLLADTAPAVKPHKNVWKNIEAQLFNRKATQPTSWWKSWAFASTALAAGLATLLVIQTPQSVMDSKPAAVAMLATDKSEAGWLLNETKKSPTDVTIDAIALSGLELKANNAFELWLLPADKSKPISLGLLPQQGNNVFKVPVEVIPLMSTGLLAVSLEPVGGSPTGQPTGAVLYQGRMTKT
ncbi:MAG: hypothetical protein CTY27_06540 [Methylotenera sp.]|nr:MAG: hypothetical protein CTY27_06540 [Methylotenera sp.]